MPLNLNHLYERDTSVMSKVLLPKAEEMSRIHFFSIFPFALFFFKRGEP